MSQTEHLRLSAGRMLLAIVHAFMLLDGQIGPAMAGAARTRPKQMRSGRWITVASERADAITLASGHAGPKPELDGRTAVTRSGGPARALFPGQLPDPPFVGNHVELADGVLAE